MTSWGLEKVTAAIDMCVDYIFIFSVGSNSGSVIEKMSLPISSTGKLYEAMNFHYILAIYNMSLTGTGICEWH